MDDKSKSEARRRKVLDNAEARLRFIKEGIPWRTNDNVQSENTTSDLAAEADTDNNLDSASDQVNSRVNDNFGENDDHISEVVQDRLSDPEVDKFEYVPEENKDLDKSDTFKNEESKLNDIETTGSNNIDGEVTSADFSDRSPVVDELSNQQSSISSDTGTKSEDMLNIFKNILTESANERSEHKKKAREHALSVRMSCIIMLCLGVIVRVCYSVNLSWTFNQVMLVPFMTAVIPRLFSILKYPPLPSGTVTQVLIMSGVKVGVINKAFRIITLFRTFLQFFSVYLISFVFTHELIGSLS